MNVNLMHFTIQNSVRFDFSVLIKYYIILRYLFFFKQVKQENKQQLQPKPLNPRKYIKKKKKQRK